MEREETLGAAGDARREDGDDDDEDEADTTTEEDKEEEEEMAEEEACGSGCEASINMDVGQEARVARWHVVEKVATICGISNDTETR